MNLPMVRCMTVAIATINLMEKAPSLMPRVVDSMRVIGCMEIVKVIVCGFVHDMVWIYRKTIGL